MVSWKELKKGDKVRVIPDSDPTIPEDVIGKVFEVTFVKDNCVIAFAGEIFVNDDWVPICRIADDTAHMYEMIV